MSKRKRVTSRENRVTFKYNGVQKSRIVIDYSQLEADYLANSAWLRTLEEHIAKRDGTVIAHNTRRATQKEIEAAGLWITRHDLTVAALSKEDSDCESETPTECDTCFPMTDCVCATQAN